MVDIHSHILPGMDDGPQTLETAIAMVTMAAQGGTTDIVATPHASPTFRYDPEEAARKVAEIQAASNIRVHRGCDLHLSLQNIREALRHPARYAINGLKYILAELPDFFSPASMNEVFRQMLAAGMIPIVTHPERHPMLEARVEPVQVWVEMGCLVQVTAQSLTGGFGRVAHRAAAGLLQDALVHFIASDAHDTEHRPPLLGEAYRYVEARYGADHAITLFVTNPRATLAGGAVTRLPKATGDPLGAGNA